MGDPKRRLGVHVESGKYGGCGRCERHERQFRTELGKRDGRVQAERSDPGPPEHSEMPADTKCCAEVAGQGSDIGARGTFDLDVDVRELPAADAATSSSRDVTTRLEPNLLARANPP